MSSHRAIILALAVLFSAGLTSAASACCGWGAQAPVQYSPAGYGGYSGCGGCRAPAVVYAPAPRPVVRTWGTGCGCACGGCRGFFYSAAEAEAIPIAPAPIYVVNQGPDYTGPGIMVPYHTWAHTYFTPNPYGYRSWRRHAYGYGYGYGYGMRPGNGYRYGLHRTFSAPRARLAYRGRFYGQPGYRRPMPGWHRNYH